MKTLEIQVRDCMGIQSHCVVVNGQVVARFLSDAAARYYIKRLNNSIALGVIK